MEIKPILRTAQTISGSQTAVRVSANIRFVDRAKNVPLHTLF